MASTTTTQHWIFVEGNQDASVYVGPYATEAIAEAAMNDSEVVRHLCEEDAADCYLTTDAPEADSADYDVLTVEPTNADFFAYVAPAAA